MTEPVCFTCRIRDQVVRLGQPRSSVAGAHDADDPRCDAHLEDVELQGRVAALQRNTLTAATAR